MADMRNLDDLFVHTLQRVYDAEQRQARILPQMAEAAQSAELKQALDGHAQETGRHIARIKELFGAFHREPKASNDEGLKGIARVGEDVTWLDAKAPVKDAALIAAAQEAEHYEIAVYGTLRTWANVLDRPDAVRLLESTLEEEKKVDYRLTAIASGLNTEAAAAAR